MHSSTIKNIKYLEPAELYNWIKAGYATNKHEPFQVIDVRDSDYIGGHIAGGWNYPYESLKHDINILCKLKTNLLEKIPNTDNTLVVNCVFHCAQSQQRGPSSAIKFMKSLTETELSKFKIWVLRGGFNRWQSIYGQDSSVTENYVPTLWQW